MHEVKIYGDIVHVSSKTDKNVSLADVQLQLSQADGKDVKVRIGSNGGDVDEGFAIYYELRRYAKDNQAKIHTFAESRLASIATVIFLAGDERELSTDLQPFVHAAYFDTKEDITEKDEAYLTATNLRIAEHYALHTELTVDEALALMNEETFIDTNEAKAMRFATSIENVMRPVALQRFTNNQLNNDMNKNPKTNNILRQAMAFLKGSIVNKMVTAADETEIDFYDLADDDVVEVGAKARIDGNDADGSYVMKSGETYVFTAGELTEIVAVEEDVNEEAVALQAEIDNLTNQLEAITNKAVEVTNKLEAAETLNKAQAVIINKYKGAGSAPAPNDPKPAPATNASATANNLDESINNLRTIKLK